MLESEKKRIMSNGGKIYQVKTDLPIEVPYRVMPGRLSVSRTIGDIEAKYKQFEGNPRVIISDPDIYEITISDNDDFILLGCDGMFDELSNEDIIDFIWMMKDGNASIHEQAASSIDAVIKLAAFKQSYDNLTAVLIAFKGFDKSNLAEYEPMIPSIQPKRVLSNERTKKHLSFSDVSPISDHRKISVPSLKKLFIFNSATSPFKFPLINQSNKLGLLIGKKEDKCI